MRKNVLIYAVLALYGFMTIGEVAANPLSPASTAAGITEGAIGFGADFSSNAGSAVDFKYIISKDWAITGAGGFKKDDDGQNTATSKTSSSVLGVGVRKYFSHGEFAPFVGVAIGRVTASTGSTDGSGVVFVVNGGAEYFLTKHFSLSAAGGFQTSSVSVGGSKATSNGTLGLKVGANIYLF